MNEPIRFQVGDWTVTPALNRLERGESTVKLAPRAMDLLVFLTNHAGRVVSNDEAMSHVWRGRVVEDSAVYKRVNQLRKALGDDPHAPTFIETIPKRGYRLIAPVAAVDDQAPRASEPRATRSRFARSKLRARRTTLAAGLTGIVLTVLIAGAINEQADRELPRTAATAPQRLPESDPLSIAVLPFTDQSATGESTTFLADGLHAELLTRLGKISTLKVISPTSVGDYREQQSLAEISRALGVANVLTGTVQRAGERVRINVRLVVAQTGEQLWGDGFDGEPTVSSILAFQTDIATSIAARLGAMLRAGVVARLDDSPTESLRAYELYLSGLNYLSSNDFVEDTPIAVQQLENAVAEDPDFALAWASLAKARLKLAGFEQTFGRDSSSMTMAREAAEKAMSLDPDLPEAHLAMANYYTNDGFDEEAALRHLAIAEAGMRGDAGPIALRGHIDYLAGRSLQAVTAFEQAIELDPRNVGLLTRLGGVHLWHRDYEDAEHYIDRALLIAPDADETLMIQADIAVARDGDNSVWRKLVENERLNPELRLVYGFRIAMDDDNDVLALQYLHRMGDGSILDRRPIEALYGRAHARAGRPESARFYFEIARETIELALDDRRDAAPLRFALAETLAALGETDRAVSLAREAVAVITQTTQGREVLRVAAQLYVQAAAYDIAIDTLDEYLSGPGPISIEALAKNWALEPLHDHPGFRALIDKYGRDE